MGKINNTIKSRSAQAHRMPYVFWHIDMHEYYDDEDGFVVYATARCPWCKRSYHNDQSIVWRQTNDYIHPFAQENPTEEEKENVRQDVITCAQKSIMNMPPFCEWCGAKLKK